MIKIAFASRRLPETAASEIRWTHADYALYVDAGAWGRDTIDVLTRAEILRNGHVRGHNFWAHHMIPNPATSWGAAPGASWPAAPTPPAPPGPELPPGYAAVTPPSLADIWRVYTVGFNSWQ